MAIQTCQNALLAVMMTAAIWPSTALPQQSNPPGDVFDPFFRYTETEHRTFFGGLPGETVDPFSGTLSIVREDLSLPGKAGLDLHIVRAYSSKIWGRADLMDMEPLLAEKEPSVLGYGWSLHMGRLKNPFAVGDAGICSGDFPIYEAPDGSARVFYPIDLTGSSFVSKDFWRLEKQCAALGGSGICIWSDSGVRYEFRPENQFFVGTTPVWPLSAIADPFGNAIEAEYVPASSGAIQRVTDSYDREITFAYEEGWLASMHVNGQVWQYIPASHQTWVGQRRFLEEVRPPAGPSELYQYALGVPVAENQFALSSITYPTGGTTSYTYSSVPFFTGIQTVPFSVVTTRVVNPGRGSPPGTWTYAYDSPGPGTAYHTTTISRPDGKSDVITIVGFGFVAGMSTEGEQYTYAVGLTLETSRADGAEREELWWSPSRVPPISQAVFAAPAYGPCWITYRTWDDEVRVPVMTRRVLHRDGAQYVTDYDDFDPYGQARLVTETGRQGAFTEDGSPPPDRVRTTTWSFLSDPAVHVLRGKPLSQTVCVGSDCFDNAWTYAYNRHYARDSETLSGTRTSFSYYTDGNLESVTDVLGQRLSLDAYVHGVPTRLGFNGAFTVSREVSWEGWVLSETNGRGFTTGTEYDAIGRVERIVPPPGNDVTTFTYAEDGAWVNLARGNYSKLTQLDGLGREIGASDSEGAITAVRYDAMGQAWFKSYPRKAVDPEVGEAFEFDGLGRVRARTVGYRPATETAPARCDVPGACRATIYHYANCVGTTTQRAPGEEVTSWSCNTSYGDPGEGRLTQVRDAGGGLWSYEYSAHGALRNVRAPLPQGNRSYEYDAHQFLVGETTPESGTVGYGRNAAGQPTSRTDARPAHVGYHYDNDPLSRLRRITYEGASADDVTQSFDEANNLVQLDSENGGAFAYAYDGLNRPLTQTWEDQDGSTRVAYTTAYGYDSTGCLRTMSYPTGTSIAMECDTAGRVKRIELTAGAGAPRVLVEDVSYHASGQVKGVTYGNGVPTAYTYDDRARATRVEVGTVVDLRYGYDGVDNVTSYRDARVAGSARAMGYDLLDRLAWVDAPGLWGGSSYGYDELGNRTSRWENGDETFYAYDPGTNRLARADGARGTLRGLKLAWDVANRLKASSDGTTYRYDGRGRRVRKTSGGEATVYHYDAAGRVIAETRPNGTRLRDYVYLGNALVAVSGCVSEGSSPPCGEVEWYHTDRLGSVVARTDEAGLVAARLEYQPWGEVFSESGTAGVRQYNGRVFDEGTGFHDYGARLYWPEVGRFVSADSHAGELNDPLSLNRYSYVHSNPYKYVDPDGHQRTPPRRLGAGGGSPPDLHAAVRAARMGNALARIRNSGARTPDTMGPGGPPTEAAVRQMENLAETVDPRPNPASPALRGSPYSPEAVDARVRPEYRPNPAHDPRSSAFDARKTPEPADAATVYLNAIRVDMGTWFGRGEGGWYRYSSDNAGGVHFSGIVPAARVPVRRGQ